MLPTTITEYNHSIIQHTFDTIISTNEIPPVQIINKLALPLLLLMADKQKM